MKTYPDQLIQIVPSLSPVIDGIGDYALQLARQLQRNSGIRTSFIVCDPAWPRNQWSAEFQAIGLEAHSPSLLQSAIRSLTLQHSGAESPVLVHFSPYGYQKRGCPFWLVKGLEAISDRKPSRQIHIAFHELEVQRTRLWSSTYWVPDLQRHLIQRLLKIGTFTYTNTGEHQNKLETWGRRDVALIPNFSNIGELDGEPAIEERAREIVIFGRADQRRWTYEKGAEALAMLCEHLGTKRIIDIGSPIQGFTCKELSGVAIELHGVLPAAEVARTMRAALASFMYYPIPLLTKSGVHALSCASGVISFVATESPRGATCATLEAGLDYIAVSGTNALPSLEMLEQLQPAIYKSYRKRSSKVAALTIAERLSRAAGITSDAACHSDLRGPAFSGCDPANDLSGLSLAATSPEVGL